MTKVQLKKHWVRTDAWRGYYEYDNSVMDGCFMYGNASHNQAEQERIKKARTILRKAKIPFRVKGAQTSNLFSTSYDVVVEPKNTKKAKSLLKKVM